jgi:hypothetical protein
MTENVPPPHTPIAVTGEIARAPMSAPLRMIATITGLLLLKALFVLIGRYLLALRAKGSLSLQGTLLTLTTEWSLWGRPIRRSVTTAPVRDVTAVRFENRQRYLYLLVGFGFLVVGTLVGVHWFLDGLRAGYPFLTLVGALIVLGGIAVDMVLYLLIPVRGGHAYLIVTLGPWRTRLRGVDTVAAERLIEGVHHAWRSR